MLASRAATGMLDVLAMKIVRSERGLPVRGSPPWQAPSGGYLTKAQAPGVIGENASVAGTVALTW